MMAEHENNRLTRDRWGLASRVVATYPSQIAHTTEQKVEIIRQAMILLGLGADHPNEMPNEADYLLCEGHIGPATTPATLAAAIAPFFDTNSMRDTILGAKYEVGYQHGTPEEIAMVRGEKAIPEDYEPTDKFGRSPSHQDYGKPYPTITEPAPSVSDDLTSKLQAAQLLNLRARELAEGISTMRDQFAMAALTGIMSLGFQRSEAMLDAAAAYVVADAMLEARKK